MTVPESLIFDISPLMETATGTRENYSFEVPIEFTGLKLSSNIRGKVEIMKIEDGFNAKVTGIEVRMDFCCDKCLKKFQQKVQIAMAERQFYLQQPAVVEDPNDLYLVNRKELNIDLAEFLRQEIILHFPPIPVCSSSCKGLCPVCGKDRNETDCNCHQESIEDEKPLAALKSLINQKSP